MDATATISGLIGDRLLSVERSEHDWLFKFAGDIGLRAYCPWRIVSRGRVVLGNCDHGQKFGLPRPIDGAEEANRTLRDKAILDVTVRKETGDLTVQFSDGVTLEVLNTSSGYEGWQISRGGYFHVIAMGGGEIAFWKERPR